jgi:hypothetical protein
MSNHVHLTIGKVLFDGELLLPKSNTNAFVTRSEWNEPAKGDGVSYVSDIAKKNALGIAQFTFHPTGLQG